MISVIMPVYNVEKYIHRSVDSVLNQTYSDFELLLIDDGSPDHCPQICDEYAQKDPRVKVIHKPNGGLLSARNAGILVAKWNYITFVDPDDWADERMLQFVHDTLTNSPVPLDMILFAAHDVFKDHMGETVNHVPEGYYDRERLEKEIFPRLIIDSRNGLNAGCIQAHTWDKACKRELLVKHYTRDERIRVFTDVPMTYECLLNCQNIYISNQHLYYYNRTNEDSIRSRSKENFLTKSFYYMVDYMQKHLNGISPAVDRQLNELPASLIIRTGKWRVRNKSSFREAVRHMKEGLRESGLLSLVSVKGLPVAPQIVILLFKLRLYSLAMLLCAVKVRRDAVKT